MKKKQSSFFKFSIFFKKRINRIRPIINTIKLNMKSCLKKIDVEKEMIERKVIPINPFKPKQRFLIFKNLLTQLPYPIKLKDIKIKYKYIIIKLL